MNHCFVALLGVLFAGERIAAQAVWKVCLDPAAVTADFADLPPAVAAASPGDTILVYRLPGGVVQYYTAPVIDKPLNIVGCLPGVVAPGPTKVNVRGVIDIVGIDAGEVLSISNIRMDHDSWVGMPNQSGIRALGCGGSLVFEGFDFNNGGVVNQVLRFESCGQVVLRGGYWNLGAAVDVINSNLLMVTSQMWRQPPSWINPSYAYTSTFPGISLVNSTATILSSYVDSYPFSWTLGPSQPSVLMDTSTLYLGAGARLGVAGGSFYTLQPGPCFAYVDSRALISQPSITQLPQVTPAVIHGMLHDPISAAEPFGLRTVGPQSGFALIAMGQLLPTPLPTTLGELWLDPSDLFPVGLVALSSTDGTYTDTQNCPLAAPSGVPFVFQSLTLAPDGTLALTMPSPFTVGWPDTVIP